MKNSLKVFLGILVLTTIFLVFGTIKLDVAALQNQTSLLIGIEPFAGTVTCNDPLVSCWANATEATTLGVIAQQHRRGSISATADSNVTSTSARITQFEFTGTPRVIFVDAPTGWIGSPPNTNFITVRTAWFQHTGLTNLFRTNGQAVQGH